MDSVRREGDQNPVEDVLRIDDDPNDRNPEEPFEVVILRGEPVEEVIRIDDQPHPPREPVEEVIRIEEDPHPPQPVMEVMEGALDENIQDEDLDNQGTILDTFIKK